jgi:hypothetical protein
MIHLPALFSLNAVKRWYIRNGSSLCVSESMSSQRMHAVTVEADKQQQWQAELEDELSRERQNRRHGTAAAARRPSTSPQRC